MGEAMWPPVDSETRRALLAFLEERGVDPDDIAEAMTEDSLWELTTELLLKTRDDFTADELAARAGLTPEQLARVRRALGLYDDSWSTEDVALAAAGTETFKLFRDEDAALRLLRVTGSSMRRCHSPTRSATGSTPEGSSKAVIASLIPSRCGVAGFSQSRRRRT